MRRHAIREIFFPPRCGICGELTGRRGALCSACKAAVSRIEPPVCSKCGRGKDRCTCEASGGPGIPVGAPFYYEGEVRRSIQKFKFTGELYRGQTFAAEMADFVRERWPSTSFDGLVPVPMTKRGRRKRGFDQVATLTAELSELLEIPVLPAVRKRRETSPQHEMKGPQRRANVYDAYDLTGIDIQGKNILVIDDVITTGSTVREIAQVLKDGGCADVFACAVALTPIQKQETAKYSEPCCEMDDWSL